MKTRKETEGFADARKASDMTDVVAGRIVAGLTAAGVTVTRADGYSYRGQRLVVHADPGPHGPTFTVSVQRVEIPIGIRGRSNDVDEKGNRLWSHYYRDRVRVTVTKPGYGGGRDPWTNLPALVDDPIQTPNGQKVLSYIRQFMSLAVDLKARERERTALDVLAKSAWNDRPQDKATLGNGVATMELDPHSLNAVKIRISQIPAAKASAVWAAVVTALEGVQ